ncbi:MAG TPA: hypothetical protein VK213_05965 [Bacteroidales bacterium]|nr:hypothetical protein [Bacteroidales bacterium]
MKRKDKIEILKGIAEGRNCVQDLQPYVFIVPKDGKNYLSDGKVMIREISDEEINKIKSVKVFINEVFLGL